MMQFPVKRISKAFVSLEDIVVYYLTTFSSSHSKMFETNKKQSTITNNEAIVKSTFYKLVYA